MSTFADPGLGDIAKSIEFILMHFVDAFNRRDLYVIQGINNTSSLDIKPIDLDLDVFRLLRVFNNRVG